MTSSMEKFYDVGNVDLNNNSCWLLEFPIDFFFQEIGLVFGATLKPNRTN